MQNFFKKNQTRGSTASQLILRDVIILLSLAAKKSHASDFLIFSRD